MSDTFDYLGTRDSGTSTNNFNVLQFLIEQQLEQVSTATLVSIVKAPYDASGNPITPGTAGPIGYVDVQPLVNQLDGRGNATEHGVVHRLCYFRYQGGHGAFISDPAVGDVGKCVFADRDTSAVRATGGKISNPGSRRKFDRADGTFFGNTIAGSPSQYFAWTDTGFKIHDKNSNEVVGSSSGLSITDAFGNSIVTSSAGVTINGLLIARGRSSTYYAHQHSGVTAGGDNSGPPID